MLDASLSSLVHHGSMVAVVEWVKCDYSGTRNGLEKLSGAAKWCGYYVGGCAGSIFSVCKQFCHGQCVDCWKTEADDTETCANSASRLPEVPKLDIYAVRI